ncbi:MAG TPA: ABC transporter permease [Candidatus Bathyarchaeota archaeon]|nr:ABC transporter permease [Candidatus Bathyarchaeota archaeon]HEX68975.1 ABC transporter permease [Candidatus Bathyarchaeota archaeon]
MGRWENFRKEIDPTIKEIKFMLYKIRKSPLSLAGASIVAFFVLLAIMAPVLAPPVYDDPFQMPLVTYSARPMPPSAEHPFGVMNGYDLYYGCIWGTITAFRVGVVVVASSLVIATIIGVIAGYYGGIIDEILMRFTDIIIAFPGLILAMVFVSVLVPAGWNPLDAVLAALILVGWPTYTRVIRGEVLRIRNEDFVEAAKAVGCSDFRIITRHILPNTIYPILIMASLDIGSIVLTAAALSFLGIGAPPGFSDWGQIISYSRQWIYSPKGIHAYWYGYTIPGIFIFMFVLGWNLLGDAFRDILDPMIRRR